MSFEARLENFPTRERFLERASREGRYQRNARLICAGFLYPEGFQRADPCEVCGASPPLLAMISPYQLCLACLGWMCTP